MAQLTDRDPALIEYIVIHHSVLPQTADITEIASVEPYLTVGYNAYCKRVSTAVNSGWIMQQGRPIYKRPAAQYGLNQEGYAICIGGNYDPEAGVSWTDVVSSASLDAVVAQVHAVREYGVPKLRYLIGHRDVEAMYVHQGDTPAEAAMNYGTLCPGKNLYQMLDALRARTGLSKPDWLK